MSKAKTRFVIMVGGAARELFNVREQASGNLSLIYRRGINHEENKLDLPIIVDRTTVHVSPNTHGTTIHTTMELQDSTERDWAAFIANSKEELLWLIRTNRVQDLCADRYTVDSAKGDILCNLGGYNGRFFTLMYSVVVARKKPEFPVFPFLRLEQRSFDEFKIGVYYSLMCVSPYRHGDYRYTMTLDDRKSVPPEFAGSEGPKASMTVTQLRSCILENYGWLGRRYQERMQKHIKPNMEKLFLTFTPVLPTNLKYFRNNVMNKPPLVFPTDYGLCQFYI